MNQHDQNKERYRELCKERDIPLFMQAWWMDAVCEGKKWNVLIYEKENRIAAVLVYHYIIKLGLKFIVQPQLTQYNGIWIDYPHNLPMHKRLSLEKEIMTYFTEQLNATKVDYYEQNFAPEITNWLPFYWQGFNQTTRYTYQIKDISKPDTCFEQFSYAKKKQINKAITGKLRLVEDMDPKLFYRKAKDFLEAGGKTIQFSEYFFLKLETAAREKNACKIIALEDSGFNLHAALFIVWNKDIAYALISAINPSFKTSGASSLMFMEAIRYASARTAVFDFEGSMDEGIENSFRQFGAEQTPYFRISKSYSPIAKLIVSLKKWK